jgi:sigma-B regulation protein RsbU (phosphoserine phosphatase)
MSVPVPVVFQYQRALDRFRREGREPPLLKRMSELISLLDLTTTLNVGLTNEEILDAALLIVMGELQVSRGALFVRHDAGYELRASRGLPAGSPASLPLTALPGAGAVLRGSERYGEAFDAYGLEVFSPILKGERPIAVLGLGPRGAGGSYGEDALGFLASVAACACAPIENGLIYRELERLNQKLSVKVFQLSNLFDISRELTMSLDEEAIKNLVTTTLMGHLMVTRCALYLKVAGGLGLAHSRGLRDEGESALVSDAAARPLLETLRQATPVSDLPESPLKQRLIRTRMALAVPLFLAGRVEGLMAAGERVSGAPFSEEDRDFAVTLGRQAMAALESVRLHQVRLEKQRQDRELQLAREIQRSLFPGNPPRLDGAQIAALSQSCYQVGGDHYDHIPLGQGGLALAIADVAGKGTPASILMASVHAWLRALAGTAPPDLLMERLSRFLFESTQDNRYVTLFYGELDAACRRLRYVNAGHVPPYLVAEGGSCRRLLDGGPVLGLLENVQYEVGEVALRAGDLLAMVTDGATEALSVADEEFGDERVIGALRASSGSSAEEAVSALASAVTTWAGPAGCSDDLTVLILKVLGR